MIRKIIKIDEKMCNGCGACASACHEGAIEMIDGKARLTREDYCDGLGDCLPTCPTGAITFEEREAPAYDQGAVQAAKGRAAIFAPAQTAEENPSPSELVQWPVQIKLAPVKAPYFHGAKLLIAADCTAYAYSNFHRDFIRGHIALIGCPKLDEGDYAQKLTEIIAQNDIKSVSVVRMEVPCCGGIENAVKRALQASKKTIPWKVVTISVEGTILNRL